MFLKAFKEGSIPDAETISLNYLPDRVLWSTMTKNKSPDVANNRNILPDIVNNTDLSDMVEPNEAQLFTFMNYEDFYQGIIFPVDDQNKTPYVDLHSALMNTFSNDNYAFIILDGYVLALIKHINNVFMFLILMHVTNMVCVMIMALMLS